MFRHCGSGSGVLNKKTNKQTKKRRTNLTLCYPATEMTGLPARSWPHKCESQDSAHRPQLLKSQSRFEPRSLCSPASVTPYRKAKPALTRFLWMIPFYVLNNFSRVNERTDETEKRGNDNKNKTKSKRRNRRKKWGKKNRKKNHVGPHLFALRAHAAMHFIGSGGGWWWWNTAAPLCLCCTFGTWTTPRTDLNLACIF